LIDRFHASDSIATFLGVKPRLTFHLMDSDDNGWVSRMTPVADANLWMNAGFFALRQEIFSYIREGDELVVEPFRRLIQERRLTSHKYEGFWACMDTYKEKQCLDDLYHSGEPPWTVWKEDQVEATVMNGTLRRANGTTSPEVQAVRSDRESNNSAVPLAEANAK
jgi:glucose-1-phosphate cytidylyltransferase